MSYLIGLHWATKSLVVCGLLIIFNLMFPLFTKNNVKPEAILCAWYVGSIIGISISFWKIETLNIENLYSPAMPLLVILALGIIIGAPANMLFGQAMGDPNCPNPALAFMIMNSAGAFAYIIGPALTVLIPRFFSGISFSPINLVGIILMILGMGLLMYKNS